MAGKQWLLCNKTEEHTKIWPKLGLPSTAIEMGGGGGRAPKLFKLLRDNTNSSIC